MSTATLTAAPPQRAAIGVVPLGIAAGLLAGLAWGVVARIWMRFISTDPEFTWSGTIYICLAPTIVGGFAGLVGAGRRRGWRAGLTVARVPACLATVLLGMGAGALMLPTLVPGGLALGRTDWPRWLRVVLAVVGSVAAVAVGSVAFGSFGVLRGVVALLWYLGLCAAMVALLSVSYAPSRTERLPVVARWMLIGLVVLPALAIALSLTGVRG